MKIAPLAAAANTVAIGMFRVGARVSSDIVVTASKPKNEYAAIAAPPIVMLKLVRMPTNGSSTPPTVVGFANARNKQHRTMRTAMTASCAAMIVRLTLFAILMPSRLMQVVEHAMTSTQTR